MNGIINLTNCDEEPIHLPGSIQPHGVLLALRDGVVAIASANAAGLARRDVLGKRIDELVELNSLAWADLLAPGFDYSAVNPLEGTIGGGTWNTILHRSSDLVVVELEPVAETLPVGTAASFRMLQQIQTAPSLEELMPIAARHIHELTGYDRVMIYRFAPDDSGEVIAERRREGLESFFGQHFPAADIPAQARRLYFLNLTRLIADRDYVPSPLVAVDRDEPPLDLTHAQLRSVSPIHCEYLRNMGVGASMSISIVVDERLWGLVACHHYAPLFVSYPTRIACESIARNLGLLVDSRQRVQEARSRETASATKLRILEAAAAQDDLLEGFRAEEQTLIGLVAADGAALLHGNLIVSAGRTPPNELIASLPRILAAAAHTMVFATDAAEEAVPELRDRPNFPAGLLAAEFHDDPPGWIFWFREEILRKIDWGHAPQKVVPTDDSSRLSPPGSFGLWSETVRGRSKPWTESERAAASELRDGFRVLASREASRLHRIHEGLTAMIFHDLRSPLAAISMAAHLLGDADGAQGELTGSISASSRRMKRLVEQLTEFTRIRQGDEIRLARRPVDAHDLTFRLVRESETGFPGTTIRVETEGPETIEVDPDRTEQIASNLISNARHHGDPSRPITVRSIGGPDGWTLSVHNYGPPIPPETRTHLFDAFFSNEKKRSSTGGLGLGLFITKTLVDAHRGSITVESGDEGTTFRVTLPRAHGA